MDAEPGKKKQFDERCREIRKTIDIVAKGVRDLMSDDAFEPSIPPNTTQDHGEMRANIMLAYRHLEDARMRLGKAIQAYEGGVSIYDK